MKITPLVKLCILAAVGCGLYALWYKGVPRHKDEPEAAGETEVAVQVGRISLATLRHGVTAYGTVEPEPGVAGKAPASARIASPVAAIVSDVNCFEGQQVEKGQTLFTLNRQSQAGWLHRTGIAENHRAAFRDGGLRERQAWRSDRSRNTDATG